MVSIFVLLGLITVPQPQDWETSGPHGGLVQALTLDGAGIPLVYTYQGLFRRQGTEWQKLGNNPIPFADNWVNKIAFIRGKLWACTQGAGLWIFDESHPNWKQASGIGSARTVTAIDSSKNEIVVATRNDLWVSRREGASFIPFPNWDYPNYLIADLDISENGIMVVGVWDSQNHVNKIVVRISAVLRYEYTLPTWANSAKITAVQWQSGLGLLVHIGTEAGALNVAGVTINHPIWSSSYTLAGPVVDFYVSSANNIFTALTGRGIFKSTNLGQSWIPHSNGLVSKYTYDITGTDEANMWTATTDGLYRGKGTENNWVLEPDMPAQIFMDMTVNPNNYKQVFTTPLGSGVAFSSDAAQNWNKTGIDNIPATTCIDGAFKDTEYIVYAGDLRGILACTKNNGNQWDIHDLRKNTLVNAKEPVFVTANTHNGDTAWWINRASTNPKEYYIIQTTNLLNNIKTLGSIGTDKVLDFCYLPTDSSLYWITENGNTYRLNKPAEGFAPKDAADEGLPIGAKIRKIVPLKGGLICLTSSNYIYFSDNGAESWSRVSNIENVANITASNKSATFMMAVATGDSEQNHRVFCTNDSAVTWKELDGTVPGQIQACGLGLTDTFAQCYVATPEGVFYQGLDIREPSGEDTVNFTVDYKTKISQGDTFKLTVTSNKLMNEIQLRLHGGELEGAAPDYVWPKDTNDYDSLVAQYYNTNQWPLGNYELTVEGSYKGNSYDTTLAFEVTKKADSTVLVDPEKVFLVPNPAVQQQTVRLYYDLSYDARVSVEIFNARGRQIWYNEENNGEPVSAGLKNSVQIDISGLGADIYFFRLVVQVETDPNNAAYNKAFADLPEDSRPPSFVEINKPFVVAR